MTIRLTHGRQQTFRYRHADITIRGNIDAMAFPVGATFALNGGSKRELYVEQEKDPGIDWVNAYKASPAELRCRDQGEFCVEIAMDDDALIAGDNHVTINVVDSDGRTTEAAMRFRWNPEPLPLPLDISDLSHFSDIQEVGQSVNGAFDLDHDLNVIRSRSPVAPDALLVIGSPHASQEATYAIRFLETAGSKWLGCGDFFAGLTEGVPPRGIKVGWNSAGMAALSPIDGARSFIAWGDHSGDPREWAIATHPASPFAVERNVLYRVRQQVVLTPECDRVRWRIWQDGTVEPDAWLCQEDTGKLPPELPRHGAASFALFQHLGHSIEWSDIVIRACEPSTQETPCSDGTGSREPFLKRQRPGAF